MRNNLLNHGVMLALKMALAMTLTLALTACGQSEDPKKLEQPKADAKISVPEDNVFHTQVEALNKAKEAKKTIEQRQKEVDAAIEKSTGSGDDTPR